MASLWFERDSDMHMRVSTKACSLFLPLWLNMDKENEITKKKIRENISYFSDPRTLNKYWKELEEVGMLRKAGTKIWMVSPHECYVDGASHITLVRKWNELSNAVS